MLHFLKDCWKFIQIHQYYTMALILGAAAAGTLMIQSSFSNRAVGEVAAAVPGGLRWMQTYIWKDRRITEYVIRKAEEAGYKAIVVTVDSPFWPDKNDGTPSLSRRVTFDRKECRWDTVRVCI